MTVSDNSQARSQAYASTQVLPHRFTKKKRKRKEEEEQNEREKDSKLITLKCTLIHLTAIFGHE